MYPGLKSPFPKAVRIMPQNDESTLVELKAVELAAVQSQLLVCLYSWKIAYDMSLNDRDPDYHNYWSLRLRMIILRATFFSDGATFASYLQHNPLPPLRCRSYLRRLV